MFVCVFIYLFSFFISFFLSFFLSASFFSFTDWVNYVCPVTFQNSVLQPWTCCSFSMLDFFVGFSPLQDLFLQRVKQKSNTDTQSCLERDSSRWP